MPFKDRLKGITKEFDSIRQDLSKIIQPGQSSSQSQNQYGYGQQQGHGQGQQGYGQQQGGYPGQQQQQYGGYPGQQGSYGGQQQQGVNPTGQSYQPPGQHQYQQPGQSQQHNQYQSPSQPPQPQWQGGGYGQPGQQHGQASPPPYGQQQQQFPPPPLQHQQSYGQPPQHPSSPPPQQYSTPPPGQHLGQQQQQHLGAPPVPYGSHPGTPQPHSPQPPQARLHQPQYGQPPQQQQSYGVPPQQPIAQPGIYWHANFDASMPVTTEWEHKQGNNNGWGNAELQNYTSTPQNSFYTGDRKLVLRAVSLGGQYTSARLVSRQRLSRPRGCLTAWLTSPCASGIWPAFWLLPAEPFSWPNDGEVDIAETWNGDCENHTCLHWGHYTPQDAWKHRVIGTRIPDMAQRPVKYEFAWDQNEQNGQGRLVWWIDGRQVMKAPIPDGTRRMRDFQVIINIAMGGNVCQGKRPKDGAYDFVVHEVSMRDEPEGGWGRFEQSWQGAREGNTI